MERTDGRFLEWLKSIVPLKDKSVLEIGCGDGSRSAELAERCGILTAIDPDAEKIAHAKKQGITNARFKQGKAEELDFEDSSFDVVIFSLSLHHVPLHGMVRAIKEAIRVVKPDGFVVFLEPGTVGSFFEAEIRFDACDGDERAAKWQAHLAIMGNRRLFLIREFRDEVVFRFDSTADFIDTMQPHTHLEELHEFLLKRKNTLRAERWFGIFLVEKR